MVSWLERGLSLEPGNEMTHENNNFNCHHGINTEQLLEHAYMYTYMLLCMCTVERRFFFCCYLFLLFSCNTKDWTQDLTLVRQVLYHLSHSSVFLLFVCLSNRISCFYPGQSWIRIPPDRVCGHVSWEGEVMFPGRERKIERLQHMQREANIRD